MRIHAVPVTASGMDTLTKRRFMLTYRPLLSYFVSRRAQSLVNEIKLGFQDYEKQTK
jgi:hypothetical protein